MFKDEIWDFMRIHHHKTSSDMPETRSTRVLEPNSAIDDHTASKSAMAVLKKHAPILYDKMIMYDNDRDRAIKWCIKASQDRTSNNPLTKKYLNDLYEWFMGECEDNGFKGMEDKIVDLLNDFRRKNLDNCLLLYRGLADISHVTRCRKIGNALAKFFDARTDDIITGNKRSPKALAEWCFAVQSAYMATKDKNGCLVKVMDERPNLQQDVANMRGSKMAQLKSALDTAELTT